MVLRFDACFPEVKNDDLRLQDTQARNKHYRTERF